MESLGESQLEDLISGLPTDATSYRRRWMLCRQAILDRAPHLREGAVDPIEARDLRVLFLSTDLFIFGARYRTAFENLDPVHLAWCIDVAPDEPDCRLEISHEEGRRAGDLGLTYLEFHVAPASALREAEAGSPVRPSGDACRDLLDALMAAMLRLMILGATVVACEGARPGCAMAASLMRRLRFEDSP